VVLSELRDRGFAGTVAAVPADSRSLSRASSITSVLGQASYMGWHHYKFDVDGRMAPSSVHAARGSLDRR